VVPYESHHGRWRVAARELLAGRGRQGGLRLEATAAHTGMVSPCHRRRSVRAHLGGGVAEVTVDRRPPVPDQRLTIAMDMVCDQPEEHRNPDQGSALWGASQVMSERLTLKDGAFEQSNFHEYVPSGCRRSRRSMSRSSSPASPERRR